jgi:hypothetical protein
MLKGEPEPVDLLAKRDELYATCQDEIDEIIKTHGDDAVLQLENESLVNIHYPVTEYPTKVKSFNFDKTPEVSGELQGIKGQYLILDTGVLNVRKFGGYKITLSSDT